MDGFFKVYPCFLIQEAIDKSVEEAELRHEETARLQHEMQALNRELAAEEEMMSEVCERQGRCSLS